MVYLPCDLVSVIQKHLPVDSLCPCPVDPSLGNREQESGCPLLDNFKRVQLDVYWKTVTV